MKHPLIKIGDGTSHGGIVLGPGCVTVLINQKPVAVLGTAHTCPAQVPGTPPIPHIGGLALSGNPTVLAGHRPVLNQYSLFTCVGPPAIPKIKKGNVLS